MAECSTCQHNQQRLIKDDKGNPTYYCVMRVLGYPHMYRCRSYKQVKGETDVAAKVKQKQPVPPAKKEPKVTDLIHLKQYVNKKVDDRLFYYIDVPEC